MTGACDTAIVAMAKTTAATTATRQTASAAYRCLSDSRVITTTVVFRQHSVVMVVSTVRTEATSGTVDVIHHQIILLDALNNIAYRMLNVVTGLTIVATSATKSTARRAAKMRCLVKIEDVFGI
jgi:hypothetical protein